MSPGAGRISGPSRYRASPATASGSRLVASTRTSSHAASSPAHSRRPPAPITCSQLSSTSSNACRLPPPGQPPAPASRPPGHPRRLTYPQRRGHHRRDLRRVPHRRQLLQPGPVRATGPPRARATAPASRVFRPARPGHRHQPVLPQQPRHVAHCPSRPINSSAQARNHASHQPRRLPQLPRLYHNRSGPLPYSPARPPARPCAWTCPPLGERGQVTPCPAPAPVGDAAGQRPQNSQVPIGKASAMSAENDLRPRC